MDEKDAGQTPVDSSWEPEDLYTMTSLEQIKVVIEGALASARLRSEVEVLRRAARVSVRG